MAKSNLKMGTKRFSTIMIPIMALTSVLAISTTITANYFRQSLDTYLGQGERVVTNPENTENWDLDFFGKKYEDYNGSLAAAEKVSKAISDEGTILLKNNGALPLSKNDTVSPFGLRYRSPIYGGTGSGKVNTSSDMVWTPAKGLKKHFKVNETVEQKVLTSNPYSMSATEIIQSEPSNDGSHFSGAETNIFEYNPEIYYGTETSCNDTVGVVFLGRIGGEGADLLTTPYFDGTPHNLAISEYEKETIKFAKENCDKVIAVINSSNVMELAPIMAGEYECDAIVWVGGTGTTGFESLGDILVGDVNPSGRTADIWDANLLQNNPTLQNYGQRVYTNTTEVSLWPGVFGIQYYEYEEGVYYGYRYYETADVMDENFVYGTLNAQGGIQEAGQVLYPFGYGMSYTSFEQEIVDFNDAGDSVEITVKVTNTGKVDGKEVVQIYQTAPYTDFDVQYEIEKPAKVLVDFEKVAVKAGESEEVTISFLKEELASYCYTRDNGDGTTGCYVLEKGDYIITLGKNSHDAWDSKKTTIANTIWYDNSNPRQSEINAQSQWDDEGNPLNFPAAAAVNPDATFVAATNQFEDINNYMHTEATIFSRNDWDGTFPTAAEAKALSEARKTAITTYDVDTDPVSGNVESSYWYQEEAPTSKAKNNLTLSDMRGKDYYSSEWDLYLDQIDYESSQIASLLTKAAFATGAIDELAKPTTKDSDGPQGFGLTGVDGNINSFAYVTETVVGATWNKDLAYAYGESIGQEALVLGINGWYGPGLNLHRSAFCGRNFEYYSEDPVLTGELGAKCISGAEQNGLVVYTKHFGAHTFENNSVATTVWMTEQAYRETDLRAFEIALKGATKTIKYIADSEGTVATKTIRGATGLMGCASLLGTEWQGASFSLITEVVRGEWGFQGVISTDMALYSMGNLTTVDWNEKVLRSGTDLRMFFMATGLADTSSPTALYRFRDAIKHICYAYANSNVTQGSAPGAIVTYTTSPWEIGLWIGDAIVAAFVVVGIIAIRVRAREEAKYPEIYNTNMKI